MKPAALALALAVITLIPVGQASACDRSTKIGLQHLRCCEEPARWASRHSPYARVFSINSTDGDATLLLTDRVVAVQLSDAVFHKVDRKLRREAREHEDEPLAGAIVSAIVGSVRSLLDHSAECPIRDLASVEYTDGGLVFITEGGDRVLRGIDHDDDDVMRGFSERDARAFVREFRKLKARALRS